MAGLDPVIDAFCAARSGPQRVNTSAVLYYSIDLRERVTAAPKGGLWRRQATARFGVSSSLAIYWMKRLRELISVSPWKIGGHKPRKIAGEHRDWLVECCPARAFTLHGLVGELAARRLKVDYRSVWEFVHAKKLSYKKDAGHQRKRPPRRCAPTLETAEIPA